MLINYGVKQIGLSGSFVRDERKEDSDIDFLVGFEKEKKTLKNLVGLGDFLEELFQKKKLILLHLRVLGPYISLHILKEVQYASFPA